MNEPDFLADGPQGRAQDEQLEEDAASLNMFGIFLVGAVLGAVAAILWAPQSGQQARAGLAHAGQRVGDRMVSAAESVRHFLDSLGTPAPANASAESQPLLPGSPRKRIEPA